MSKTFLAVALVLMSGTVSWAQPVIVNYQLQIQIQVQEKERVENKLIDLREMQRRIRENIEAMSQRVKDQSERVKQRVRDLKRKADESRLSAEKAKVQVRYFRSSEQSVGPQSRLAQQHFEIASRQREINARIKESQERTQQAIARQKDFIRSHR